MDDLNDEPTVQYDRRGFLKIPVALVSVLSLSGGTTVAQQLNRSKFESAAMLIGPYSSLPTPGGPFFANKTSYHYIYWVTDDSGRWEITEDDNKWSLIPGSRPRLFDSLTEDVLVSNTMVETTVFESTVDAGTMLQNDVYSLVTSGTYTTTNTSEQFTLRFYLGDVQLAAVTSVAANVVERPWYAELQLTLRAIGTSGLIQPHTVAVFDNSHDDQHAAEESIDTAVAETFSVTVEWDEANVGDEVRVGQASFKRLGTA